MQWKKRTKELLKEIDKRLKEVVGNRKKGLTASKTGIERFYNNLLLIEELVEKGEVKKIKFTIDNNYLILTLFGKKKIKEFRIRKSSSLFEEKKKIIESFLNEISQKFPQLFVERKTFHF